MRDRIGDPPAVGAPQRAEWEQLCRELERDRLERERDTAEGLPQRRGTREDRARAGRVDELREQLGLPALEVAGPSRNREGIER
ncbi:MAG: hypothetical protein ABI427_08915 [Solirubrobacteraceae bacterium]